jgi:hypothetical protein
MLPDSQELASQYAQTLKQVWRLHNLRGLSAAIYTQTSDVETECNGLQTYDRAVRKVDPAMLSAANRGESFLPPRKIILADALFGRADWKYTTEKPSNAWPESGFEASTWKEGVGGFGATGTPGIFINTSWTTSDIWLRREFDLEANDIPEMRLQAFHDEDAEIYFNGVLGLKISSFSIDYEDFEISKDALAALHGGKNTIAVHCHQSSGGQGIDVGIILPLAPEKVK